MKKIICLATDGGDREDGSVYYSGFIIVESTTLKFDEPIFKEKTSQTMSSLEWITAARALGYQVEEPLSDIVIVDELT